MYLALLLLGAVTTVTGFVLVAPVVMHDSGFDVASITPGAVAAVGGLVLIGIGFAVRELQRVERLLSTRPVARPVRASAPPPPPPAAEKIEQALVPENIPFAPRAKAAEPRATPAHAAATNGLLLGEDGPPERWAEKLRLDKGPPAQDTDFTKLLRPSGTTVAAAMEARKASAAVRTNGAAAPSSSPPRLEVNAHAAPAEHPRGPPLESFWPKGQRPRREAQQTAAAVVTAPAAPPPAAVVAVPVPPPASPPPPPMPAPLQLAEELSEPQAAVVEVHAVAVEAYPAAVEEQPIPVPPPPPPPMPERRQAIPEPRPAPTPDPRLAAAEHAVPSSVSILKSGVVEGMAYTLYSDGSIDAQMPQGMMRFGSITELRNHVDRDV